MLKFSGIGNGQQGSHLIVSLHLNLGCIRKKKKGLANQPEESGFHSIL